MKIRQSFCYPCFRSNSTSVDDLMGAAARIGYAATEFWAWEPALDDVVSHAKDHGLAIASFTGHESIEKGFNDAREHERIERELKASIDRAAKLGIRGVIAFAGGRNGHTNDLEDLAVCAKGLRKIAPYAESAGVNVNIEILNSRVNHHGYLGDRVEWGVALCEMVASPRVKILFDIYHVQIMQGDIVRRLRESGPHIGHIHTAGNPGRHDLDEGEMDYTGIARAISDMGYDGYVGHEFFTKRSSQIDALKHAFEICDVA